MPITSETKGHIKSQETPQDEQRVSQGSSESRRTFKIIEIEARERRLDELSAEPEYISLNLNLMGKYAKDHFTFLSEIPFKLFVFIGDERFASKYEESLSRAVYYCNFKSLLAVRLVSKRFYNLISFTYQSAENLRDDQFMLLNRSARIFEIQERQFLLSDQSAEAMASADKFEKISFNSVTNSKLSFSWNLFNLLSSLELTPNIIVFKAETIDKIRQMAVMYSHHQLSIEPPKTFKHIQELNFQNITINKDTYSTIQVLLATISQNLSSFSSLTSLTFGNIEDKIVFDLPDSFNILTHISISYINSDASVCLPALNTLTSLSFDSISGKLSLLKPLDSLTSLSIGVIHTGAEISFPEVLNGLTKLSIGIIFNATLNLPKFLDALNNVSIGIIHTGAQLFFPKSLPNLESFHVQRIDDRFLELPKFASKKESQRKEYVTISFDDLLPNALSIPISIAEEQSTIILRIKNLHEFNKLNELLLTPSDIKLIDSILTLDLKKIEIDADNMSFLNTLLEKIYCFPKLTNLEIGDIASNTNLYWLTSLSKLESVTIGDVGSDVSFDLSGCDKLQSLVIGDTGSNITFKLSNSIKEFQRLIIGDIGMNVIFILPTSLNKLPNINDPYIFELQSSSNDCNSYIIKTIEHKYSFELQSSSNQPNRYVMKTIRDDS